MVNFSATIITIKSPLIDTRSTNIHYHCVKDFEYQQEMDTMLPPSPIYWLAGSFPSVLSFLYYVVFRFVPLLGSFHWKHIITSSGYTIIFFYICNASGISNTLAKNQRYIRYVLWRYNFNVIKLILIKHPSSLNTCWFSECDIR